jgi:hypothetical protein
MKIDISYLVVFLPPKEPRQAKLIEIYDSAPVTDGFPDCDNAN